MRRMLISSSPLASPGHGQLALSWQPSALIALAGVLVVALAGAWPLRAWTLAALTVPLGAPVLALVLAAAVLAGAGALAGAVGGLLAGPRAVDPLAARVIRLLEAGVAAGTGPPDNRGHRSPTSAPGRCPLPQVAVRVGSAWNSASSARP